MRRLTARQRLAAQLLTALAVLFLTLDMAGGSLAEAHNGTRGFLGALYRGTDSVLGPVRRFVIAVPEAWNNQDKVSKLKQENAQLRAAVDVRDVDAKVSGQLAKLQLRSDALGRKVVPARVVALGPGAGFDWTVSLNVGTHDGIKVDQTVVAGDGLVGRVLQASASSSVVLLAADPGSGVGVRDVRSSQLGVATGSGMAGYVLSPLDPNADLKVGDVLRTGPVGKSSYVGDLPVGVVVGVNNTAQGGTTATVRPAVSASGLDLVGVIIDSHTDSALALTPR